jgi:hypothetical protein
MSSRAHLCLRVGAAMLLAAVALWPRSKPAERPRPAEMALVNVNR